MCLLLPPLPPLFTEPAPSFPSVAVHQVAADLKMLIETANAPIFGIDADGMVNEWNAKASEITGFRKEEVLGQHLTSKVITSQYRTQVSRVGGP